MAVLLPTNVDRIGPLSRWGSGPYPPTSLAVFEDFSLGNGDNYGLYWPIGREAQEPLVVETVHDAAGLVPAFSSVDSFLNLTMDLDEADHAEWPSLDDDPKAPHALYHAARAALAIQEFETAKAHLMAAVQLLPEYTAAQSLLVTLYAREGLHAEACLAAVHAVRSPPSFGWDADVARAWNWLSRQSHGPSGLADDPIWSARASLASPPKGGMKENDTYPIFREAIGAYAEAADIIAAVTLMQTYAEYMIRETTSFQDRYGFMKRDFQDQQASMEIRLPHGRRALA